MLGEGQCYFSYTLHVFTIEKEFSLKNKIDFSKAVVRDGDDPFLYTEAQSKAAFSADFGLAYTWKKLEIGF